jgi:beta-lactam-binding protein with PASTA domain
MGKRSLILFILLCLTYPLNVFADYTITPIDVPNSTITVAYGINNSGTIVGNYNSNQTNSFLLNGCNFTTFSMPGEITMATAINNSGQIVGTYGYGDAERGFLLSGGSYSTISPPGAITSFATGINDSGQIVGFALYPTANPNINYSRGFLFDQGNYTFIDIGSANGTITGINNLGQIVGQYDGLNNQGVSSHFSFLLSGNTYTIINVPGAADTRVAGINNLGQIVGTYSFINSQAGVFLYKNGVYTTFTYQEIGWMPLGINDLGQIVGENETWDSINNVEINSGFLATPNISVPSVVGLLDTEAENAVKAAWLKVGAWDSEYHNSVPIAHIISQDPPAGTSVPVGSSVILTTSLGPQPTMVAVPNIVGMTQQTAMGNIDYSAGLTVGTVTQAYSSTVKQGLVISQSPAAGTMVALKSPVNFVISLGPPVTNVPNVVSMTNADAQSAIIAANLAVGTVTQSYSNTVVSGNIISSSPIAGATVIEGTTVNLTVSLGQHLVAVPDIVGMTQQTADGNITYGYGLAIGTVTQAYSNTVVYGIVISQDPAAGASVSLKTPVNYVVSLGPPVTTVPNVVGMTQSNAQSAITAVNLSVGTVTESYNDTVTAGNVITQDPAAGASVVKGTSVNLTVSKGKQLIAVPDIVGMAQQTAMGTIMYTAGLTVGTVSQAYSNTVAFGNVISQDPAPGTMVAPNALVNYVVSLGPPVTEVPNFVGMNRQTAIGNIIYGNVLTVGTITEEYSDTVPYGVVISQFPGAGTSVVLGTSVNLTLSLGQHLVAVPNIVGMIQQTAMGTIMYTAGLTVGTVTQGNSDTIPELKVCNQSPAAGTLVALKTPVNFVISIGPVKVAVPNIVGMTQQTANGTITYTAGLTIGTVTQAYSSTVAYGNVISQDPPAGTMVLLKTPVSYVVSIGPPITNVPNVVGMTQANAQSAIKSAHLVVGTITQAYSNTVPEGSVISQSPGAGATVVQGTSVNLTVSLGIQKVAVPNVVGMYLTTAQGNITFGYGLTMGTVTWTKSSTVRYGYVISQNPSAGTLVLPKSPVSLVISSGP